MNRRQNEEAKCIKAYGKLLAHPILCEVVEWVSSEYLLSLTDPNANESSPTRGINEPFAITIGSLTQMARVERGALEIREAVEKQIAYLPTFAVLSESHILDRSVNFEGKKLIVWAKIPQVSLGSYADVLRVKPSFILPSCPVIEISESINVEQVKKRKSRVKKTNESGEENTQSLLDSENVEENPFEK